MSRTEPKNQNELSQLAKRLALVKNIKTLEGHLFQKKEMLQYRKKRILGNPPIFTSVEKFGTVLDSNPRQITKWFILLI